MATTELGTSASFAEVIPKDLTTPNRGFSLVAESSKQRSHVCLSGCVGYAAYSTSFAVVYPKGYNFLSMT